MNLQSIFLDAAPAAGVSNVFSSILPKVAEIKETHVIVEIANGVVIKIDKSAIIMDMSDAQTKR